ncbi:DUF1501 domain-containing protein [Salinispirillum sp. LH 10-3-1]|uniref:DUF1501 domain-containing protein n=1 Tax=Salinispirillum sp. LH 10-3-1 TaxID=2952525 RepID=A0AB38YDP1_9GAMM
MKRREFLKASLGATLGSHRLLTGAAAGALLLPSTAQATPASQRTLVQLTLDGGPDFRHLFVPPPNSSESYGKAFWQHNYRSQSLANGNFNTASTRYWQDYLEATVDGNTFGVLKEEASWLHELLTGTGGHGLGVAVICNVVGSPSRDHVHSLLALDYGRHDAAADEYGRSGWAGRLADVLDGRVLSLTRTPRNLCYMPDATGSNLRSPTDNPLTILDARTAGLFDHRGLNLADWNPTWIPAGESKHEFHWNAHMSRAMSGYYKGLSERAAVNHRIERVIDHERTLRRVGQDLADALNGKDVLDTPASAWLNKGDFARQMRTLHDMLNHASDALDLRVASIDMGGWDSHDNQKNMIEPNFSDLFGTGKGLHTLFTQMDSTAKSNTLLVINGEFGRQIKSNFDAGTDHGRGNYMLLIGQGVRTGIYGEMFPEAEIDRMHTEPSPEIEGKTTIEHLHKAIADWVASGNTGQTVVNRSLVGLDLESGLDLNTLFT